MLYRLSYASPGKPTYLNKKELRLQATLRARTGTLVASFEGHSLAHFGLQCDTFADGLPGAPSPREMLPMVVRTLKQ